MPQSQDTEKLLPLSPMLVQYLVALCAIKWDEAAVNLDVTLGDMVPDVGSGTPRDVDVTVTVNTDDGIHAFKGYEVKPVSYTHLTLPTKA